MCIRDSWRTVQSDRMNAKPTVPPRKVTRMISQSFFFHTRKSSSRSISISLFLLFISFFPCCSFYLTAPSSRILLALSLIHIFTVAKQIRRSSMKLGFAIYIRSI